jgi:hypothetical protein
MGKLKKSLPKDMLLRSKRRVLTFDPDQTTVESCVRWAKRRDWRTFRIIRYRGYAMTCGSVTRLGRSASLFVSMVLLASSGLADDNSFAGNELPRIRAANQAAIAVVSARLALQRFHLARIQDLYKDGHATWIELARQEALVESLCRQSQSLASFGEFLEVLADEIRVRELRPPLSRNPVKLYLPGSQRLIGWIDSDRPRDVDIDTGATLNNDENLDFDDRINLATARLHRAEAQSEDYDGSGTTPAGWAKQARLLRDVARAELNLLTLRREGIADVSVVPASRRQTGFSITGLLANSSAETFVTAGSDANLCLATLAVAEAEAAATGTLDMIEVQRHRARQQLAIVEQLHSRGLASERQIQSGRQQVIQAEKHLEQEREGIVQQQAISRRLAEGLDGISGQAPVELPSPAADPGNWPESVLANGDRLRHLIELRRTRFELEGLRAADQAELEMRRKWQERLQRVVATAARMPPGAHVTLESERLASSLQLGEQRQIDALALTIKGLQARVQAAGEQMAILGLEERRFILQCQVQERAATESFTAAPFAFQGAGATPAAAGSLRSMPVRYLECQALSRLYAGLVFNVDGSPCYFGLEGDRPSGLPLLQGAGSSTGQDLLSTLAAAPSGPRGLPLPRLSSLDPRPPFGCDVALHGWYVNEPGYRIGTGSNRDIYPNGILRGDWRDRIPAGLPPWYLPGSPTNLDR